METILTLTNNIDKDLIKCYYLNEMVDRIVERKQFSNRDVGILSREGLMIYQLGLKEIAVYEDPDRMFVPRTFDESFDTKSKLVRKFNREFQSRLGTDTVQVFWTGIRELTNLLSTSPRIIQRLLEDRYRASLGFAIDSKSRLPFRQFVAGVSYSEERLSVYDWCDCGFMSGGVLLTVRPRILSKNSQ